MSKIVHEQTLAAGEEVILTAEGTHTVFRVYWNGERWFGSEGEYLSDVIDHVQLTADEILNAAEPRLDDDGNPIIDIATCGHCGRSWNDALITSITPTPAGRCPFEYDHEEEN